MPLSNTQAHLSSAFTTLVTATELTTIVHFLVVHLHPNSDIKIDVIKTSGSDTVYLLPPGTVLPFVNRKAEVLPLKPLTLEPGETIQARAYGTPIVDWNTASWNTLVWTNIPYSTSTPVVDAHLTVTT